MLVSHRTGTLSHSLTSRSRVYSNCDFVPLDLGLNTLIAMVPNMIITPVYYLLAPWPGRIYPWIKFGSYLQFSYENVASKPECGSILPS